MPPCTRRVWRAAHRSTNSSPNEYPSTGAAIVPFMTYAPFCASGFQSGVVTRDFEWMAEQGRLSKMLPPGAPMVNRRPWAGVRVYG